MEMVKDIVDECMVGWLWKELGILHLESLLQSEVHEGDEEVQGQAGGECGGGHGGGEHGEGGKLAWWEEDYREDEANLQV